MPVVLFEISSANGARGLRRQRLDHERARAAVDQRDLAVSAAALTMVLAAVVDVGRRAVVDERDVAGDPRPTESGRRSCRSRRRRSRRCCPAC